jgi:carbamate kinase
MQPPQDSNGIVVVSMGMNAFLRREQKGKFDEYVQNVALSMRGVVDLIERGYDVVLTHGNGPQLGATLLRHEAARGIVPMLAIDACTAETQGFMGYLIQQTLTNELRSRRIDKYAVTIVTRAMIDPDDISFAYPTRLIGPFLAKNDAAKRREQRPDYLFMEDAGRGFRRVVPSPEPKIIDEARAVRALVDQGFVVIACGGGGIPFIEEQSTGRGLEAVIDKDLAAERLATSIRASVLLILTDVDGAYLNYGSANQKLIRQVRCEELRNYLSLDHFKKGSMAPKVLAAIRFVENGGNKAIIAAVDQVAEAIDGRCGTSVTCD